MPERLRPNDVGIGRLFFQMSDAVVVGNTDTGLIELWNPAACDVFGYTEDEAIGMPIADLVAPDVRELHLRGLARYRSTGAITVAAPGHAVELPAKHRDGHRLWVSLTLAELPAPDRSLVVACLRDVTDRRNADDALVAAHRALRQFIAVAAHDLRGPLSTLNGSLELLIARRDELSPDIARLADIASRHGRGVMQLVIELLDLAQLDAGVMPVRPGTIDVADVIQQTIDLAGIDDVGVDVADDARLVEADSAHVRRILMNLIANAERHGRAPITVSAAGEGEHVAIRVSDAGPGVPHSLVSSLFEPYVRDERGEGTGLGLAIARRLAVLNGGDVFYLENPHGGACFTLSLPCPTG